MSMTVGGVDRMMQMKCMHGMGFRRGMEKSDAGEIANRMINNRDKDDDGAIITDELGKFSDMLGPVEADFLEKTEKPDASEIAHHMIYDYDKDRDGALSADELGKLSDKLGLVEADFNDDGLVDQEKLISKISEKLEKMEGPTKMRGLEMHPIYIIKQLAAEIGEESTDVISETQSSFDLVKQLLGQLDLSEKETEKFLETMKNYGIKATA